MQRDYIEKAGMNRASMEARNGDDDGYEHPRWIGHDLSISHAGPLCSERLPHRTECRGNDAARACDCVRKLVSRRGDRGRTRTQELSACFSVMARRQRRRHAPKIDQPIRLVSASSAMRPRCELPFGSSPGDHAAMDALPGAIAKIPPPTPLFPGSPTR